MDYENYIVRDYVQVFGRKRLGIYMGFYLYLDNLQMYGYLCKIRYFLGNLNINVDNVLICFLIFFRDIRQLFYDDVFFGFCFFCCL